MSSLTSHILIYRSFLRYNKQWTIFLTHILPLSLQTSAEGEAIGESMSFKDKKKFFEQEIAEQLSDQPKYKGGE